MKSVNKVILVGCLGHDPEVKDTAKVKMARLSIATNTSVKDDTGHWEERAEWHSVILWDRLADIAEQYLKKGSRVYVEGRLQTRSWEDKDTGEKKYRTQVIAGELVMLGDAHRTNGKPENEPPAQVQEQTKTREDDVPF